MTLSDPSTSPQASTEPPETAVLRAPFQIVFGSGSRQQLAATVAPLGTRAFVCSDSTIAATTMFQDAIKALRSSGVVLEVFTGVEPELPLECVDNATSAARRFEPTVILGFGGGSSLDIAKILAINAVHDQPLSTFYGENRVPSRVLPVVAVPTTAGTGSEATPVAVVADPTRRLKVGISSPYLIPTAAIVDPELTISCPASVTAHSGIDALTHAVEAYTSRAMTPPSDAQLPVFVGANPLTGTFALKAIPALFESLPTAVHQPDNMRARTTVAYGSCLAGIAFGTSGTHLSHALQYPIGDLTNTSHGLGVGLLLPYVLEACLPYLKTPLTRIGEAIGVVDATSDPTDDTAAATIQAMAKLRHRIGIPHTLAEIGVRTSDLPSITDLASGVTRLVDNAPAPHPQSLLADILDAAHTGRSDIFPTHARER